MSEKCERVQFERSSTMHSRILRTMVNLINFLTQGYEILKGHEIWDFPQSSTTLFKTFLKIKQVDSRPSDVGDDKEKRREYIRNYEAQEGVLLDYHKIERNPAKHTLANSFCGKFRQQSNKFQVETFNSPVKLYQFLDNDEIQIRSVRVVNPEMLEEV